MSNKNKIDKVLSENQFETDMEALSDTENNDIFENLTDIQDMHLRFHEEDSLLNEYDESFNPRFFREDELPRSIQMEAW